MTGAKIIASDTHIISLCISSRELFISFSPSFPLLPQHAPHMHNFSVMPFFYLQVANPPPLPVGKKSEGEKGSADKSFPSAAKDSSEQVGFCDASFCNSEHNSFPIFVKTTQLPIFIPSNQCTIYCQAHLRGEIVSHITPY